MSTLSYQLEQRVGVVTGGSSGIGLETVRLMLGSGMRVAFCGRDEARLAGAERALRAEFPQADLLAARCDVLDAADTEQFAAAVAQRFGATDSAALFEVVECVESAPDLGAVSEVASHCGDIVE